MITDKQSCTAKVGCKADSPSLITADEHEANLERLLAFGYCRGEIGDIHRICELCADWFVMKAKQHAVRSANAACGCNRPYARN